VPPRVDVAKTAMPSAAGGPHVEATASRGHGTKAAAAISTAMSGRDRRHRDGPALAGHCASLAEIGKRKRVGEFMGVSFAGPDQRMLGPEHFLQEPRRDAARRAGCRPGSHMVEDVPR
jgi:hypothetical protein